MEHFTDSNFNRLDNNNQNGASDALSWKEVATYDFIIELIAHELD